MPIVTDDENPVLWNLVYAAKGSDVDRVFVHGELLVEKGRLVKISDPLSRKLRPVTSFYSLLITIVAAIFDLTNGTFTHPRQYLFFT